MDLVVLAVEDLEARIAALRDESRRSDQQLRDRARRDDQDREALLKHVASLEQRVLRLEERADL